MARNHMASSSIRPGQGWRAGRRAPQSSFKESVRDRSAEPRKRNRSRGFSFVFVLNWIGMRITSPAFQHGETIPRRFGRNFENINPPLAVHDVPSRAVSFVLFMDDPDVPSAARVPVWDHWVVFNVPSGVTEIPEAWKVSGVQGSGTRGEKDYAGPVPPDKEHRYFFRVYALDAMLDLREGASRQEVTNAMRGHVLASAELMGRFAPSGMNG